MAPRPIPPGERFARHVDKAGPTPERYPELGPCWRWTATIGSGGYGNFGWTCREIIGAHCASWRLTHGDIPSGACVLHRCDQRWCVNPTHLFLGTKGDNARDMAAKRRSTIGERNPRAKLTEKQVAYARASSKTRKELAEELGVSVSNISQIRLFRTWVGLSLLGEGSILH